MMVGAGHLWLDKLVGYSIALAFIEVIGSTPVEALNFSGFSMQLLKL